MAGKQAGRHYANVFAADSATVNVVSESTASLRVPGSVLQNMLPSDRDKEQQFGLKAKSVPKGSFTTAEGSCFEKDVQDKKMGLSQETWESSRNCFPF